MFGITSRRDFAHSNGLQALYSIITRLPITPLMNERNEVADFYRRELTQALNEQAFGISHSEVTRFTENEAEATVTLLEGTTISIVLSNAGYKVL